MERPTPLDADQNTYRLFQVGKRARKAENANIDPESYSRIATIHRSQSGEPRGVAIWINDSELKILGIDPTNTAALEVQVTEDGIRLTAANEYD